MILIAVVVYLFSLVFLESELVTLEARNEHLMNRLTELQNEKKRLDSEVMDISNLAVIEIEAKKRGFVFPRTGDILGVVK
jgi:cell division protein FtsL